MYNLYLDLNLNIEVGEQTIFSVKNKILISGLADHEYPIQFSILTFILRWRSKRFFLRKMKLTLFGLADYVILFVFRSRPLSRGGGLKSFFGQKLNYTFPGELITNILFGYKGYSRVREGKVP